MAHKGFAGKSRAGAARVGHKAAKENFSILLYCLGEFFVVRHKKLNVFSFLTIQNIRGGCVNKL